MTTYPRTLTVSTLPHRLAASERDAQRMPQAPSQDPRLPSLLERLATHDEQAWSDFIEAYAPPVLATLRRLESDPDDVADAFLYVCEELRRNRCRRLRKFRLDGPASFATWLRAVVRNLDLDWRRRKSGRYRVFQSISKLPVLEQEVFRAVYWDGVDQEAALSVLRPRFPDLDRERLEGSLEKVRGALSSRQLWLLSQRRTRIRSLDEDPASREVADAADDPEVKALRNERRAELERGLESLSKDDRLLIRFRYEKGLTLAQVGRLTGLGNAQRVDRRVRKILTHLKQSMERS